MDTLYDVLNSFFEPPERLVDLPLRTLAAGWSPRIRRRRRLHALASGKNSRHPLLHLTRSKANFQFSDGRTVFL